MVATSSAAAAAAAATAVDHRSSTTTDNNGSPSQDTEDAAFPGESNDVSEIVQAITFSQPSGLKASKAFLHQSHHKDYWNKKISQVVIQFLATHHATNVLKLAATQNESNQCTGWSLDHAGPEETGAKSFAPNPGYHGRS